MDRKPFSKNEKFLMDAVISGGWFQTYLEDITITLNGNICLVLDADQRIFPLPCRDGQGEHISVEELCSYQQKYITYFSDALCTNYIFLHDMPAVVLFDDEKSIQKKIEMAAKLGIFNVHRIK